jgi:uncharacterized protein involved in exopolysaccharide biosynthesis
MPESATKNSAAAGSHRSEPVLERRTLRDYYVIIREHIWLALAVSVLVSVSLGYYLARQTPVYSSTSTLQFQRPERVVTSEAVSDTTIRGDADINTYLQLLGSARLRARIAESFTPVEVAVLQKPYLANLQPGVIPPSPGMLINDVSIEAVRNSLLVTVTARAQSAESAALVANRFVEEFIDFLIERGSSGNEEPSTSSRAAPRNSASNTSSPSAISRPTNSVRISSRSRTRRTSSSTASSRSTARSRTRASCA